MVTVTGYLSKSSNNLQTKKLSSQQAYKYIIFLRKTLLEMTNHDEFRVQKQLLLSIGCKLRASCESDTVIRQIDSAAVTWSLTVMVMVMVKVTVTVTEHSCNNYVIRV
jgi:hypothetical protein